MKVADIVRPLEETFAGDTIASVAAAVLTAEEWSGYSGLLLLLSLVCYELKEAWEGPVDAERADALKSTFLPIIRELAAGISSDRRDVAFREANRLADVYSRSDLL